MRTKGGQTNTTLTDGVATNGAVFFHVSDVSSHGALAGLNPRGEINVGHASVLSELCEDGSVDFSDAWHASRISTAYLKEIFLRLLSIYSIYYQ